MAQQTASEVAQTPKAADSDTAKDTMNPKLRIPSTTEVSFRITKWGYEIWLPPPILAILGDTTIEAGKRTAIITTALTWVIHYVPTAQLPSQAATAISVLRTVLPLSGFVGGLVIWLGQIKSVSKGHGVVLSFLWLLPVVPMPRPWDESYILVPAQPESVEAVRVNGEKSGDGGTGEKDAGATLRQRVPRANSEL